jgi:predicted ester cyclase
MGADARALLREYLDGAFNRKDPDVIDEVVAPDVVDHAGLPGGPEGIEGFRLFVTMVQDAFPDLELTIEDSVAEGDRAVARWSATATHKGELLGMAPTDRAVTMSGIDIARAADGKIVEFWAQVDMAGLMVQLTAPEA